MNGGYFYMMANRPGGMLYVGVAADLAACVARHRAGTGSPFCRRYNLTRLVYAEEYQTIEEAIAREKAIKAWQRAWKVARIEAENPDWDDFSGRIL